VATTLAGAIRDVDFIARYGGEEFFVMMPELEASAAAEQAERIRQRIAQETFTGDPVTLSMGMAEFPAHGDSGESLIAAADAALYEAKHAGRNRWAVARPPSAARAAGR
jgi:diguanylate cyclase (GGDEF)-like protein